MAERKPKMSQPVNLHNPESMTEQQRERLRKITRHAHDDTDESVR